MLLEATRWRRRDMQYNPVMVLKSECLASAAPARAPTACCHHEPNCLIRVRQRNHLVELSDDMDKRSESISTTQNLSAPKDVEELVH